MQVRLGFQRAAALLGVAILAGCAASRPPPITPESTLVQFSRALNQARFAEAYALMSEAYRTRVSREEFERRLKENPEETADLSRSLGAIRGTAAQEATVHYGDDQEIRLELRDGRWYVATNLVDYYDQSTPRAALRSFLRAMERRRYDVVMRLVPESDKDGVTPERMQEAWSGEGRDDIERMLHNLRSHLDAPIEVFGAHATMPYAEHLRVEFVREGEAWKIADPE